MEHNSQRKRTRCPAQALEQNMASEARQAEGWARELAVEARTGGGWPEAAAAGFVNRVLGSARQKSQLLDSC